MNPRRRTCTGKLIGLAKTHLNHHSDRTFFTHKHFIPALFEDPNPDYLIPNFRSINPKERASIFSDLNIAERKWRGEVSKTGLPPHLSLVHSYFDAGIHGLIMSHWVDDPAVRRVIIFLCGYLLHWIDDLADGPYAKKIKTMPLPNFMFQPFQNSLTQLHPKLGNLWQGAMEYAIQEVPEFKNRQYDFESEAKRMFLNGVMFSSSDKEIQQIFIYYHQAFFHLLWNESTHVGRLVGSITPGSIANTSKVLSLAWRGIKQEPDANLVQLTDLFIAPGVLVHDDATEKVIGEDQLTDQFSIIDLQTDLRKTFVTILKNDDHFLKLFLEPIPLFIDASEDVLRKSGWLPIYLEFLTDPRVKKLLPDGWLDNYIYVYE
ncbi:MAG: hypothetical protein JWQ35_232 [Bacteriovoracaceae bacterium]|nr:hypothetical protein [Bacteriovoracaceae bacterium]